MLQIKVKGNKKYSRFLIDSIKMEINNSSDTLRMLRLKTLPEHKQKPTHLPQHKIQYKHHHTLESIESEHSSHTAQCTPKICKVEKWEQRDQNKNLCQHYNDKRSRLSYNLQTVELDTPKEEKLDDIRFSLHQVEPVSSDRSTERKAIINLEKLHSMNSKVKSNLRHQSLMPLSHVQKNCRSNEQLKKSHNSYLIYTPQKASSLSYKEILEGHCIESCKVRPIESIKHHHLKQIKQSRAHHNRVKTLEEMPLDQFFKENQANAVKLRFQRRENMKKMKPLETNLSPWRTNQEGFPK